MQDQILKLTVKVFFRRKGKNPLKMLNIKMDSNGNSSLVV